MKRILIVTATTGYQTRAFAEAAAALGMTAVLATDRCHVLDDPWGDGAIAVRFDEPAAASGAIAAGGPFEGIIALGDRPALVASLAAAALGIPYNDPPAVEAAGNKFLSRRRLAAAGLPVPEFFRVPIDSDPAAAAARASYPCVLKPLGLSASRGVIRAGSPDAFVTAFRRIEALLIRPEIRALREEQTRYLQVESFIEGKEYALEGVLTEGRLQTLALFEKPDPLDGPFFEETIYIAPARVEPGPLIEAAGRAVGALGLTHGPVHAEMRFDGRRAVVLEAAARPIGGLCAKALRFDGGMALEELLLRHAAGEDVSGIRRESSASGVMMIPIDRGGIYEGVEGVDGALRTAGVEEIEITAKIGQKLEPLPEGASYLGFIFARGETPADVERSLREGHRGLKFQIAAALPVMR
ncbi:MAG TPA: ATP-grasp domain-containing protein [Bryobacteraceae bacterium]|jgi:biotin carboxylase|nr:ATP-grasp domain-containing protein [Bryobacteraceae bacterium]